jgi:hypothetical protein
VAQAQVCWSRRHVYCVCVTGLYASTALRSSQILRNTIFLVRKLTMEIPQFYFLRKTYIKKTYTCDLNMPYMEGLGPESPWNINVSVCVQNPRPAIPLSVAFIRVKSFQTPSLGEGTRYLLDQCRTFVHPHG